MKVDNILNQKILKRLKILHIRYDNNEIKDISNISEVFIN